MSLVLALSLASAPQIEPVAPASSLVERPRRNAGVGWLVTGALAGATGLGLGLASARELAALDRCPECPPRLPPTMLAAVALNTASLSLLTVGAGFHGRARGSRSAARSPATAWISFGGMATTGGLVIVAAGLGWQFAEEARASSTPWSLLQLGLSSVIAGSSMLVYGLTYRKYAPAREVQLALVPTLARGRFGLALAARF
ncbi:hypothetical protein SAMN02745121_08037 [Nannocystis exedens]|uniref:Uncharacterized protein n=1 Tax=Nannocystis exedens TaxID=54 RepID=A0A1I2HLD4_9BACT|nr:hypothetical protein [Nannocystis exedens]PCC71984.1 hypothetical protein NAEX_05063 [Nannocystis exedens]SFF30492.1 hypothetical protein SAMN02745121_08037 [Nannocystis exedens]